MFILDCIEGLACVLAISFCAGTLWANLHSVALAHAVLGTCRLIWEFVAIVLQFS